MLALFLFSVTRGSLVGALGAAVLLDFLRTGPTVGLDVIIPTPYPAEAGAAVLGTAVAVNGLGAVPAPHSPACFLVAGGGMS